MELIRRGTHFFTADTHFGDDYVFRVSERDRFFSCVEEMDEAIVERWNEAVAPRDTVWLLGDVTTDVGPTPHLSRLNGTIHLIAGNHDTCFAGFTPDARARERQVAAYRAAGVASVVQGVAMEHERGRPVRVPLRPGLGVDVSHFPYDPDPWRAAGEADPWARWRPRRPRRGPAPWLVHGHVHTADTHLTDRQVNVAMDMWDFEPVPAEVIAELITATDGEG